MGLTLTGISQTSSRQLKSIPSRSQRHRLSWTGYRSTHLFCLQTFMEGPCWQIILTMTPKMAFLCTANAQMTKYFMWFLRPIHWYKQFYRYSWQKHCEIGKYTMWIGSFILHITFTLHSLFFHEYNSDFIAILVHIFHESLIRRFSNSYWCMNFDIKQSFHFGKTWALQMKCK